MTKLNAVTLSHNGELVTVFIDPQSDSYVVLVGRDTFPFTNRLDCVSEVSDLLELNDAETKELDNLIP